jgi:hypothetical protein
MNPLPPLPLPVRAALRPLTVALGLCLLAGTAMAQNSGGIYSCIDSKGRRLTSDRPIPECLDREQRELGSSGVVRRVVPPSYTAEERAKLDAQRKAEELQRARVAEEKRRDKALLVRYPNQAMHDKERADALLQIDEVVGAVNKRQEALGGGRRGKKARGSAGAPAQGDRRRAGVLPGRRQQGTVVAQAQARRQRAAGADPEALSDRPGAGETAHQRPLRRRAGQAQDALGLRHQALRGLSSQNKRPAMRAVCFSEGLSPAVSA